VYRLAFIGLAALATATAHASEPRQHDGGFFLRLAPGFGTSSTKIDELGDVAKISGPAGNFDVALGFGVSRNVVLHASIGAWAMVDPEVEFGGTEFETEDLTTSLVLYGVGATAYLGDSNVYVSGTVGLAKLSGDFDGEDLETDSGYGFEVSVGKEWWVGDRWGLGFAGVYNYHSVPEQGVEARWKGSSFGVRFSATLN
jgi:hypothetical protein